MSENTPPNTNSSQAQPPQTQPSQPMQPPPDWRELRREERRQRREERRAMRGGSGAWIGGVILILLGAIFLLQNAGIFVLRNWWAVFILIPALGSLWTAYTIYRNTSDTRNPAFYGSLVVGVFLLLLALAFLFGINTGVLLPIALIIGGGILLVSVFLNPRR